MATKEEKIREQLDGLSREHMFQEICRMIADWDLDTLIEAAQQQVLDNLVDLDDEDFRNEFYKWNYHNFELLQDDPEEMTEASQAKCECDMHQLMRGEGHDPGCPDAKERG